MKKLYIFSLLLLSLLSVSCKKDSLQTYLVESQEKKGFITIDIPASVLQLNANQSDEEDKTAYESIRKINITGLPYKNSDEATYEAEKNKLKELLNKSSYKKLMNFKNDGVTATVYYSGEADAIDEIIALGYGKDFGVGIARILGKNMNPSKIMSMMKNAKVDLDGVNFDELKMVLKDKQ
ncbi:DUF4252 domain-containing protein [Tenacibaculum sp. TC6]|uniref:DUF4252 domain-containing protein n=1 Tax=Tenacibaculum sp. TC6 TaxID=3423223 RepID=UPI003D3656D5